MKWGKEKLSHLGKNDLYFLGNEAKGVTEADHDADPTLENELTSRSSSLDFSLLASCKTRWKIVRTGKNLVKIGAKT